MLLSSSEPLVVVRKRLPPPTVPKGVVLLIHGFGQNRYTWHVSTRSFSNFLAQQGWDVFNLDLRGHGRSRDFGAKRPRVLDEYIQHDVPSCMKHILELTQAKGAFLVGHSMGGLIAYSAAATSLRDTTHGVVSLAAPYRFGRGSWKFLPLRRLVTLLRFAGVFNHNPEVPLRFIGRQMRRQRAMLDFRWIPIPMRVWSPGSIERDVLDEYLYRAFDPTSVAVALQIFDAGRTEAFKSSDGLIDYSAAFEWLDKPLLVIAGAQDDLVPPLSVKPAFEKSHSSDKTYREVASGHIDIVMGQSAPFTVWPMIEKWMSQRLVNV